MSRNKRDRRTTIHVDQRVMPAIGEPHPAPEVEIVGEITVAPTVETLVEVDGETTATTEGVTVPVPRRYMPPQCTCCTALRGDDASDYTRVVSTRREEGFIVRYLKCAFCGNTFKESERI